MYDNQPEKIACTTDLRLTTVAPGGVHVERWGLLPALKADGPSDEEHLTTSIEIFLRGLRADGEKDIDAGGEGGNIGDECRRLGLLGLGKAVEFAGERI